jgi:GT2 family glycosyltransferase
MTKPPTFLSPTVSVVMTVWNGAAFVSEAIDSILDQTFADLELIVVNDGSTDATQDILDGYQRRDRRVRIVAQQRRGVVPSANRGCGLARGHYLARLDADDVALPHRLEAQVEFLDHHPEIAAVGGAAVLASASGEPCFTVQYPATDEAIREKLPRSCPLLHSAVTMRRAAFEAVGGYRLRPYAEDYDLWLRLARTFRLANLDAAVVHYRVHDGQVSSMHLRELAECTLVARAAARQGARSQRDYPSEMSIVTSQTLSLFDITDAEIIREEVMLGLWYAKLLYKTGSLSEARGLFRTIRRLARADVSTVALLPLILEQQAYCYYRDRKIVRGRLLLIRSRAHRHARRG